MLFVRPCSPNAMDFGTLPGDDELMAVAGVKRPADEEASAPRAKKFCSANGTKWVGMNGWSWWGRKDYIHRDPPTPLLSLPPPQLSTNPVPTAGSRRPP